MTVFIILILLLIAGWLALRLWSKEDPKGHKEYGKSIITGIFGGFVVYAMTKLDSLPQECSFPTFCWIETALGVMVIAIAALLITGFSYRNITRKR